MSDAVKLGSKLPGDFEVNGLDGIVDDLNAEPKTLRAAFVLFDVEKITVNADTGTQVPTVRVRRFEPLGKSDEISAAIREAYTQAVEQRTGRTALPLDMVEVLEEDQLPEGY